MIKRHSGGEDVHGNGVEMVEWEREKELMFRGGPYNKREREYKEVLRFSRGEKGENKL